MHHPTHDPDQPPTGTGISRRRALGIVAGGAVAGSAGLLLPATAASAHGEIVVYPGIANQRTVYEGSGELAGFGYRPSFHDRMSVWMRFWANHTPAGFQTPFRVWTWGVHADHRESEAHNNGRGFDLTRIYVTNANGVLVRRFNGRYDLWNGTDSAAVERQRYWATAASLHLCFRNVLTYYWDAAHHNHIHIDNLVSGLENSFFDPDSPAQVQHVQACCRFIWGKGTAVDGSYGPQTTQDAHEVLVRIGEGGFLTGPQEKWAAFNRATCLKGYGVQEF